MTTEAEQIEAVIADMALAAKEWTPEQFASRVVGLLIHDKGNLSAYQRTIELVLQVHRRMIEAEADGNKPS